MNMNFCTHTPGPPRWLHVLALLTVLCTLPLLFLGAGVTSHGVGMVDPQGFRPPWVIVNGLLENNGYDWRLEYGHRTFGFLVGMCGICLAIGCWFFDSRPWMGWLGFLALALICVQGMLGIFRVDYNALHGRTFALIHGCLAQIVFATLVCVAVCTSRLWVARCVNWPDVVASEYVPDGAMASLDDIQKMPPGRVESVSPALQRWAIVTMLIVFAQLVLGGLVRHKESLLGPRGHLLGAFLVVGAVVWLLKLIRDNESQDRFVRSRILLMLLLTAQLLLGMESWLVKFFVPTADLPQLQPLPMHGEWIRTAHYLVGTLLFSTTVVVALIANRKTTLASETPGTRPHTLEGAL